MSEDTIKRAILIIMIGFGLFGAIAGFNSHGFYAAFIGWFRGIIFSLPFGLSLMILSTSISIGLRLPLAALGFISYSVYLADKFNF